MALLAASGAIIAMSDISGVGGSLQALLFPVTSFAFAFLLVGGLTSLTVPAWAIPAVGGLARWSYSMYLVNGVLLVGLVAWSTVPTAGLTYKFGIAMGFVLVTILLSAMIYIGFERPILRLRDRLA